MANELRAVVVDDEPLGRDELVFLLGECGDIDVVGQASNANEAVQLCERTQPDVAFVDLHMPGPDGVALAESIAARYPNTQTVIVSAHDDGAVRAYEARVVDYMLKPVRLERLQKAVAKVREQRVSHSSSTRLAVKRKGSFVIVDLIDVIYFEMQAELVWAITEEDRFALDYTLTSLEKMLAGKGFFRSHRGNLVRLDKIVAMEPTGAGTFDLLLQHPNNPRVPLARERARELRKIIPVAG